MKKTKIEITYFNNKFKLELTPEETIKFINYIDVDITEMESLSNKYNDTMIEQISNNEGFYEQYRDLQLQNWKDEEYSDDNYPFEIFLHEEMSWIYQIISVFLKHRFHLSFADKRHRFEQYEEFKESIKIDLGDFIDHYPEYAL